MDTITQTNYEQQAKAKRFRIIELTKDNEVLYEIQFQCTDIKTPNGELAWRPLTLEYGVNKIGRITYRSFNNAEDRLKHYIAIHTHKIKVVKEYTI